MSVISVIVPVFNGESGLEKCLNSILNQTHKELDVIIVDDGSTDNSPEICDQYSSRDPRVKVIHKSNEGVSSARNRGIEAAIGEYIAFVDCDDWIDPNMYETMLKIAQETDSQLVMCDCIKEYSNHSELYSQEIRAGYYSRSDLIEEYFNHLIIMENIEYPPTISNWTLLIRSDLIDKIRYPVGIRFSEDLIFGSLLVYSSSSFYYCKKYSPYHYQISASSASHRWICDKWKDYRKLYQLLKDSFSRDWNFDFTDQIQRCLLFFLYQFSGEVMKNSPLSNKEKRVLLSEVLSSQEVSEMFKYLDIKNLQIPINQKMITYILKYQFPLKLLIAYYDHLN